MKSKNEIIYSINVEDIQKVALEEVSRELTDGEIESIRDSIGERIDWLGAITESIKDISFRL